MPVASSRLVDVTVDQASPALLRGLMRQHLHWLFGACGVAAVGIALPGESWAMSTLRGLLVLGALAIGWIRLMQINGILAELKRRTTAAANASTASTPMPTAPAATRPQLVRDDPPRGPRSPR